MDGTYEPNSMSSSSSPHATSNDKSPLSSLNLNFLKTLSEKRTTRDGNPPKRRGPKPDSKPALTRRQELNRQAQRTHRERKELYIKALEDEVLRLKEVFSNVSQDKDKLAEENRQLRSLLHQNGIAASGVSAMDDVISNPSMGYTSSGSISGSYAPGSSSAFTPPMTSISSLPSVAGSAQMMGAHMGQQHPVQSVVDYDQAGIDFVLTLEKPCMDHLPWLLEKGSDNPGEPCGHALMASCPPEPFAELNSEIPFGNAHGAAADGAESKAKNGEQRSLKTWELSKGDLTTLLDLSKRLDLDGEITPVMAWGMILGHPRLTELTHKDFEKITDDLKGKVRCYGFGAVMEEFEVRDSLNAVLSAKPEATIGGF
ncbi:hypothetical protein FHL15_002476 [Xylaria flabelliformis]|uniref:BZIP domain-containing protein n=1 Tax=Xylaria flabelliformis TaxID=2512241 RepID=A0A553I8R0_9PEZI|nr:hypothetical protein FHL15_002476 [Xylaria flabelliformis]